MQLYKFALWVTIYNNSVNKMVNYMSHSSLSIIIDMPLLTFLENTEKKVSNESRLHIQLQNICWHSKNAT